MVIEEEEEDMVDRMIQNKYMMILNYIIEVIIYDEYDDDLSIG